MSKTSLIALFLIAALAAVVWLLRTSTQPETEQQSITIEQVLERHESKLMAIEGVSGIGISERDGKPCLKVFLEEDSPTLKSQIPSQLDGFEIDIEVTGPIKALPPK